MMKMSGQMAVDSVDGRHSMSTGLRFSGRHRQVENLSGRHRPVENLSDRPVENLSGRLIVLDLLCVISNIGIEIAPTFY